MDQNAKNQLKTNGWYIADGYSLDDLKSGCPAEVYDDTMLKKTTLGVNSTKQSEELFLISQGYNV